MHVLIFQDILWNEQNVKLWFVLVLCTFCKMYILRQTLAPLCIEEVTEGIIALRTVLWGTKNTAMKQFYQLSNCTWSSFYVLFISVSMADTQYIRLVMKRLRLFITYIWNILLYNRIFFILQFVFVYANATLALDATGINPALSLTKKFLVKMFLYKFLIIFLSKAITIHSLISLKNAIVCSQYYIS